VVPVYEVEEEGVFYNTAAVIGRDGAFLGKYRKAHIPHVARASGRSSTSAPATSAFPSSTSASARSASISATTATSPRARARWDCNGAEIVFNPSATVAGLSEYLWKIEQPAHAVANGYFVGAINRVGTEAPWNLGEFFGQSYFCNPRGKIIAEASRDKDEIVTADLDLDMIAEVRRTWQFYRDRRPEMYGDLVKL
jgi:beta-ureidopropionase